MLAEKYRAVFKRLETDEELRARAAVVYVVIERKTTHYSYYGPYESTERVYKYLSDLTGKALDDALWEGKHMQRRIVEDVTR